MYLQITICLSCFDIDQVSPDIGLLFLITKYGYLYLCDLESCACLCSTRISTSIIFSSTLNSTTHGILGVTRSGQVRNLINKRMKVPESQTISALIEHVHWPFSWDYRLHIWLLSDYLLFTIFAIENLIRLQTMSSKN